jgi:hypothetical protein
MVEVISLLASFGLGAAASWTIAHYYYRRTEKDAVDALFAQRLDSCNEGDKTFLVAMLDAQEPIPLYACINVEFETHDGRKGGWGSNSLIMSRSVNARAKQCTQRHSGNRIDEDRTTVSLTRRGRENAEYLLRKEYKRAWFSMIDDSDEIRLGLFRTEHKREPRKAG